MPDISTAIKWMALLVVAATVLGALGISVVDLINNAAIPSVVYAIDSYAVLQSIAVLGIHGSTNGNGNGKNGNGNGHAPSAPAGGIQG